MRFEFILAEKANHSVSLLCRVLGVSRSGFYRWLGNPGSAHRRRDIELAVSVEEVHRRSKGRYGSPRVFAELQQRGERVGRKRVERLMRESGLMARPGRRFHVTTDSAHQLPVAPNLLGRRFGAEAPDRLWAADITYLPCRRGFVYLAVVIDLFSRRVVGWSVQDHLRTQLALEALQMALEARKPSPGLIHHSDRGTQYAASDYREQLSANAIACSMSRKGDCWDNAPVESFFSTLEFELLRGRPPFTNLADARTALFEYIEAFYNTRRLHSALGYQSPAAMECQAA